MVKKTHERAMSDSVYKVIEIIGTSKDSPGKMQPRSRSSARARRCAICAWQKLCIKT